MSKLTKYSISNDKCFLVFQGINLSEFKTTNNSYGLINYTTTGENINFTISCEAYKDDILVFNQTIEDSSNEDIFFDFQFLQEVDYFISTLEILNPSIITQIYGFSYTNGVTIINNDGLAFMPSLTNLGGYNSRFDITSNLLFKVLQQLTVLNYVAKDIKNFDIRFFSVPLLNLYTLYTSFPVIPLSNYYLDNLKQAPNLENFIFSEPPSSEPTIYNFNFQFDTSFSWSFKLFECSFRQNVITYYDDVLSSLPFIETISIGNRSSWIVWKGFDLTYPLNNSENNIHLKKITFPNSTIVHHDSNSNYFPSSPDFLRLIYPTNIEKLTSLEFINFNKCVRGDFDDLFLQFVQLFYEKIYNETDPSKHGYSISLNSNYFQNLPSLSNGFIHPSFRKHWFYSPYGSVPSSWNLSSDLTHIYNQINLTGFELYIQC